MAQVQVGDVVLDYERRGESHAPAVLLVAGLGGQRVLWPRRLLDGLVERGLQVIAFDNRDSGQSTVLTGAPGDADLVAACFRGEPLQPPYRLADMAGDAVGLLAALGVEEAHVVGASMGGMIGQHLAFDHGERVASLVTLNSTSGAWSPDGDWNFDVDTEGMVPPEDPEEFAAWFLEGCRDLSGRRWFDEDAVRGLAHEVHRRGSPAGGYVRQLLAILDDGDRTERLTRVACPTLVVHGADDPLITPSAGRQLAEAIPGARFVLFEDMGHDLPLPLVPALVELIAEQVAQVSSGSPAGVVGTQPRSGR